MYFCADFSPQKVKETVEKVRKKKVQPELETKQRYSTLIHVSTSLITATGEFSQFAN